MIDYETIERARRQIAETLSPLKDVAEVLEAVKKMYVAAGPLASPQQRRVVEAIDNQLRVCYRAAAWAQKCTGSIPSKAPDTLSPRSHSPAKEVDKTPAVSPTRSQGREQSPPTSIKPEAVRTVLLSLVLEDVGCGDLTAQAHDLCNTATPDNGRLERLITAIPTAANWTSRKLAGVLLCDHTAIVRTRWWIHNRKDGVAARIDDRRRRLVARRAAWDG